MGKRRKYTYTGREKATSQKSGLALRRYIQAAEDKCPFNNGLSCYREKCLDNVNEHFPMRCRRMVLRMSRTERRQWVNDRHETRGQCFKFGGIRRCYRLYGTRFNLSCELLRSVKKTEFATASADPRQVRWVVQNRNASVVGGIMDFKFRVIRVNCGYPRITRYTGSASDTYWR